jgi:hypothetical protein
MWLITLTSLTVYRVLSVTVIATTVEKILDTYCAEGAQFERAGDEI